MDLRIEYYVPDFHTPNPVLTMEVASPSQPAAPATGTLVSVTRRLTMVDGVCLLEFNSVSNRIYFVEYSSDMVHWKTAWPSIRGSGNRVQWIDNGPPRTESTPTTATSRCYRVLLAP